MTDWEEIKRLAADFQRTQESDTLQRISERNCIDIVKKLTDLNLIELIYTCDGKEFLTPAHLVKEIEDEVHINGGRMHLHDLATNLNVDYQHVEFRAKNLARVKSDEYNLILGQIIHSTYKSNLEKQVYDTMITTGQLSIADFSKTLDLPTEFLSTIIKEIVPKVMDDFVVSSDERTYYTADMMDRYKSIIVGTLSAISKPTTIASIMKKLDIPERLFTPIVDGLIKDGRIDATIENRLFIPAIYAREQNEWIDKFYTANSYIEYDMLLRKDIKQPKAFLKKKFPDGIQLKTCIISPAFIVQVESHIEDCIASNSLIDIQTVVPPSIQSEDIDQLLQDMFKKNKQFSTSCRIFDRTNVCSLGYIATCKKSFNNLMQTRANEHLREGKLISYFMGGKTPGKSMQKANKSKDKLEVEAESKDETNVEQENKDPETTTSEAHEKGDDTIELTQEDIKREKRNKKSKVEVEQLDSDNEQGTKRAKGRKSGGGTQGREIKQKSVKKKYLAGSKNQRGDDGSDDDAPTSKAPRSNKGRAARRGVSPERPSTSSKAKGQQAKEKAVYDEPLSFMSTDEIVDKLKFESRDAGEFSDSMFESIANMLEVDLSNNYRAIARQVLDDYLKSRAEEEKESGGDDDIDLVD